MSRTWSPSEGLCQLAHLLQMQRRGHMAAECAEFHAKTGELKMFGFAIPD
jgi:hypothetical protein